MGGAVAFVLKGYPRLSESFIAQEIKGLEDRGLDIRIVSLRHPTDPSVHPVHREIRAPVTYLPEYLHQEPWRVVRAWWRVRRRPGYRSAFRLWRSDLAGDLTRNRIRRFGQALVLADELPADTERLHAHFLHTPASVARYASKIVGLPWSCSAHAKDIWTTPDWELREKLSDVDWLTTCTEYGLDRLTALAAEPERLMLIYHGIDFARFPRPEGRPSERDGRDEDDPVIILSVGRAVAKKGYDVLLQALAELPAKLNWRFVHIGGGELSGALERRAAELSLDRRIDWRGAQRQEEVLAAYRGADLFVLASRIAGDSDRDGLPNVLMEAQSQGLPSLASRVAGIPELIEDGVTGLLVEPESPAALTSGLARLIREPALRAHLGAAGQDRLWERFGHDKGLARLAQQFGLPEREAPCESRSMRR